MAAALTTKLVGNVALNFNLIANAEAWPRLGLSPSFTRLRARQQVGRRFLRCRSVHAVGASSGDAGDASADVVPRRRGDIGGR